MGLRIDARSHVEDPTLISEVALQAEEGTVFRTVIVQFLKNTHSMKSDRPFGKLFMVLDAEFLRGVNERALVKLSVFRNFIRQDSEDIAFSGFDPAK